MKNNPNFKQNKEIHTSGFKTKRL